MEAVSAGSPQFGALRALGRLPESLAGIAEPLPTPFLPQVAPLDFAVPENVGATAQPGEFFQSGIPTVGALRQLPATGLEFLSGVLERTGTPFEAFRELSEDITPATTVSQPAILTGGARRPRRG